MQYVSENMILRYKLKLHKRKTSIIHVRRYVVLALANEKKPLAVFC